MTNRIINLAAFAVLTLLWLIFAIALVFNRELLASAWQTLRGWPLVMQVIVWLLTLPVTLGLWIWQTAWPLALRLVLILGLAWATVYTFYPWKKTGQREAASAQS